MKHRFRVEFSKKITAAEEDANPLMDRADELKDRIEDDFDYVVAGIERLGREGQINEAIDIMEKIADTLDTAIAIIGDDFDNGEPEIEE